MKEKTFESSSRCRVVFVVRRHTKGRTRHYILEDKNFAITSIHESIEC